MELVRYDALVHDIRDAAVPVGAPGPEVAGTIHQTGFAPGTLTRLRMHGGLARSCSIVHRTRIYAVGGVARTGDAASTFRVQGMGSGAEAATANAVGDAHTDPVTAGNADGMATAPGDYSAVGGVLNWAAGDGANQTIVVPIVADAVPEPAKKFTVTLSAPTGATLRARATVTVTIRAKRRCRLASVLQWGPRPHDPARPGGEGQCSDR